MTSTADHAEGRVVGKVTSAVYSPRLEKNIALALMDVAEAGLGTQAVIEKPTTRGCVVVPKPFYDPRKLPPPNPDPGRTGIQRQGLNPEAGPADGRVVLIGQNRSARTRPCGRPPS